MKKAAVAALGAAALFAAVASSEDPTRIYTQPALPSAEALDRLNLKMAWSANVPMDGRRDRFSSIQVDSGQLIIQTRSGLVTVLDGETGRYLWRARPGRSYQQEIRPAFNSRAVFATDSMTMFSLDRNTGAEQWEYPIPTALATDPIADEGKIYICTMVARVTAFYLPVPGGPVRPPTETGKGLEAAKDTTAFAPSPSRGTPPVQGPAEARLTMAWDFNSARRLDFPPAASPDALLIVNPTGQFQGLAKSPRELTPNELYRSPGESPLSAPPGQAEDIAYLGAQDGHVYAVGIASGKLLWRYTPGTPTTRRPFAVQVTDGDRTDRDLYVTAEDKGLARINQDNGEPQWSIHKADFSPEADRVLAVNPKFVYATDRSGRLLVLDRRNGAVLSRYDVHDYVVPVTNEDDDRVYLASNDGLIVCLHDKDYVQPLAYRKGVNRPGGKSLQERIDELKAKLAKPVKEPGGEAVPLTTYLNDLQKRYDVRIQISEAAYREMGLPHPADQKITPPKADDVPLGTVLQQALDQVNSKYSPVEDVILVYPALQKKP
jgi:outer membrane protein assembly factor BamB